MHNPSSKKPTTANAAGAIPKLVGEKAVAEILGVTDRALQKWRLEGGGPKFVKISARCIRYRPSDLEVWIEDRVRNNTSEAGPK